MEERALRFSIIIPVYNVEKYIRKCLDSIVAQTFSDYEVILVNDETPDNSMAIVQEYVDVDPIHFHVIHQKNKGPGGARNTGIAAARGEYLVFVDSDDYIRSDMLEGLDQKLHENECDMLMLDFFCVYDSGKMERNNLWGLREGLYDATAEKVYLRCGGQSWSKVINRDFYLKANVPFPEKIIYEDQVTWILLVKAQRVYLWNEAVYFYYIREGSCVHSKISARELDIIASIDLIRRRFIDDGLYDKHKYWIEVTLLASLLNTFHKINMVDPDSELLIPIAEYTDQYFTAYDDNPYLSDWDRRRLELVRKKQLKKYHTVCVRRLRINKIKAWLLRFPFVARLNQLRKRNRAKNV